MTRKNTDRRTFLKKTTAAAAATLAPTLAFPNLKLKPYAGKSLTIYQQASPIFEGAFALFQPYFEDLTGAKISFVSIPNADLGQQIALRCRGLLLGVRSGPARLCLRSVRRLLPLGMLPQLQLSQLLHLRWRLLLGTTPRPRPGGIAACASGCDED